MIWAVGIKNGFYKRTIDKGEFMKGKLIGILLVCLLSLALLSVIDMTDYVKSAENENVVYVSSNGSDMNDGTFDAPFGSLDKALEEIMNGGEIVLKDIVQISEWNKHYKSISITGGTLKMTWANDIVINDSINFHDINLLVNSSANIFANGNKLTIGENVVWTGSPTIELHGGGNSGTTVESTDLTVLSGTYKSIFGGSKSGTVLGDTRLFVGGTVNSDVDETNHALDCFVFGGGNGGTVLGNTNVEFGGSAKVVYLYGGSNNAGATIGKKSNLTITGGTGMSAYGGNRSVDSGLGANFTMTGGKFEQVFGANERASMTGDVDMRLTGGEVTRRVYGGCYNDYSWSGWSSTCSVSGQINLELGGEVDISLTSTSMDRGIYARSRYNQDVESTRLVFTSEFAYNKYKNCLGGDYSGAYFKMSAADEFHYYQYEKSGNIITQTCAYHNTHSATATFYLEDNLIEHYNGGISIEPAEINYSEKWEYDKPEIIYQNNTKCGVATCYVNIGTQAISKTFTIVESPTILGGSVRLSAPAGLRFQSKVSEEMVKMGATFGTLVIPHSVLGGEELTVATDMVENIKQTKWATDIVKNDGVMYEDGYEYFNAVLTGIPKEYYGTIIVARSYVCFNGVYYYSATIERSIAQVAAFAIQDGYKDSVLYTYVDTALKDATISLENEIVIGENGTYRLTLSGTKGYVAVWFTDNNAVVTVDKNGNITALTKGQANVIAKVGTTVLQCRVIVRDNIADGVNELPLVFYE